MGMLDAYDTAAGVDRIDGILADAAPMADTGSDGVAWPGSVIVAEFRVSPGVAYRNNGAELAALHRAWTSELATVLTDGRVRHLTAVGDRLWALYATPTVEDVARVFELAARANTLRWVINIALHRHGRDPIDTGIGVEYGQLTTTISAADDTGKAVFLGEPIGRAEHLAERAGRGSPAPVWFGADFAARLDERRRQLLTEPHDWAHGGRVYTGNIVDQDSLGWVEDQAGIASGFRRD